MHTRQTYPTPLPQKLEHSTSCLGDQRPSRAVEEEEVYVEGSPAHLSGVPTTHAKKSEHQSFIQGAPVLLESRGQMSGEMGGEG